jgi:hypothetical protein
MDPKIAKYKTKVLLYNKDIRNLYLIKSLKHTKKHPQNKITFATQSQNNPYKNIMLKYIQNSMCDFLNILLNKNKIQNIIYNIFIKKNFANRLFKYNSSTPK